MEYQAKMIKFNDYFKKELMNLYEVSVNEFKGNDIIYIIDTWERRLIGDLCICKRNEKKVIEKIKLTTKKESFTTNDIAAFIESAEETNGLMVFIKVDKIS